MADDWLTDDPFVDPDDPESIARAQRRREREERRRKRQAEEGAAAAPAAPPEPPPPEVEQEPAPEPEPPAPPAPVAPAPLPEPPAPAAPDPEPEPVFGADPEPAPVREPEPEGAPARQPAPEPESHEEPPAPPPSFEERFWGDEEPDQPSRPRAAARGAGRRGGALLLLLLPLALVLWVAWSLFQPFHGDGSGQVRVEIPEGASVGEVGDILDREGVVSSSTFFEARVTLAGKREELYPGTYTLASGMSYGAAIDALSVAPVKRTITVTIPEGLSRAQVVPVLREEGVQGDYVADTRRYGNFDPAEYGAENAQNLEGFLFPATYDLPARGTTRQLVARQLDAFKQRLAGVDLSYAKSKNLTAYDVVIIASMIEREVQIPEERRLVSAVIYNRLHDDIPLGIDATIRFAVNNYTSPLTLSELKTPSPYNTRTHLGLPPGPIGNPGEAALRAAANPAQVDYRYYVVAPGTCGEHNFSRTYEEFTRDSEAYDEAQAAAGGSPDTC